jgi:hypothetical protein
MGQKVTPGYKWADDELDILWERREQFRGSPREWRPALLDAIAAQLRAVRPLPVQRSADGIEHALYSLSAEAEPTSPTLAAYWRRRQGEAVAPAKSHSELEALVLDMIDEMAGQAAAIASLQGQITALEGEIERVRQTRSLSLLERAHAMNGNGAH